METTEETLLIENVTHLEFVYACAVHPNHVAQYDPKTNSGTVTIKNLKR